MSNSSFNFAVPTDQAESIKKFLHIFSLGSNEQLEQFSNELLSQTPRGTAILAMSGIEWRLRETIKHRLVETGPIANRLLGSFDKNGSLDSVELQMLAFCLGVVGPIGYADLERMSTIRNRFAHRISIQDFSDPAIKPLCNALQTIEHIESKGMTTFDEKTRDPRWRFIITSNLIASMIASSAAFITINKTDSVHCW